MLNLLLDDLCQIQKKENSLARRYSKEWLSQSNANPMQLAQLLEAIDLLEQNNMPFAARTLSHFYNLA